MGVTGHMKTKPRLHMQLVQILSNHLQHEHEEVHHVVQVAVQRLKRRLIVHEAAYDAGACARQSCNQTWRPSNMGMGRKGNAGFDLTPGLTGGCRPSTLVQERGGTLSNQTWECVLRVEVSTSQKIRWGFPKQSNRSCVPGE